jgi:hypothetical protein
MTKNHIFAILIIILALFVRIYRIDESSRFLFDESRDLVNIHQIWVEKKITLVGPISEDRSHVYSSLTYYMLLAFAVMFNFDPLGPVVGAVFWGLVTFGLFVWCIKMFSPRMLWFAAVIGALWFPFVQLSRWAWNPNLIFIWFFSGLILSGNKKPIWQFFSGLALGLTVHHHYLAIIPLGLWVVWKRNLWVFLGIASAIFPFVIFDLRHPPGIFITRMIGYNRDTVGQNILPVLLRIPATIVYFYDNIFMNKVLSVISIFGTLIIIVDDIKKMSASYPWLFIWLLSLIPITLFKLQFWYLYPTIPFFLIWLFFQRKGMGAKVEKILLSLIIAGSLLTISGLWYQPDWQGDLRIVRGVTEILEMQIKSENLKNPNLAVLGSDDIYTNGNRYRNMLLIRNVGTKPYNEYGTSDNLFVITTTDEKTLRRDPALEITDFRNGPVAGIWQIPGTGWKVIQFNKY